MVCVNNFVQECFKLHFLLEMVSHFFQTMIQLTHACSHFSLQHTSPYHARQISFLFHLLLPIEQKEFGISVLQGNLSTAMATPSHEETASRNQKVNKVVILKTIDGNFRKSI